MSRPEDSELKCSCGLTAKLRISQTRKNQSRLFYNCPKDFDDQCEFFQWADEPPLTGDRHTDELNLIRHECTRLQERIIETQQQHDNDRTVWEREKSELTLRLSTIQAELDRINKKIIMAKESDLMPPLDKLSNADDEADDAKVIHTIGVQH